ncbi:phage tail protein [Paraburkholderia hospita]|nr:phage tail protein [Paraburkholderia hospita]
MDKANSVRAALNAAMPDLVTNPEKLKIFADAGKIVASMAATDSFDYQYTLNVILLDFTGDPDFVFLALVKWMRVNQPDMLLAVDRRDTALTYEADFNDDTSVDLSIKLALTESVVANADGTVTHVVEPVCDGDVWTN